MDFLILSRAELSGSSDADDDSSLNELHWSYMDGYADRMTARGPTLGPDRETWTGSMHVVDLADTAAAQRFVDDEPYHRAGLFAEHSIWRFTNLLGRTMWQYAGTTDEPNYLVIARGAGAAAPVAALPEQLQDRLILYGELTSSGAVVGIALAVQAASGDALLSVLADPRAGLADRVLEVHDWEFGGRR
jgi:uncharacterized protein YciI